MNIEAAREHLKYGRPLNLANLEDASDEDLFTEIRHSLLVHAVSLSGGSFSKSFVLAHTLANHVLHVANCTFSEKVDLSSSTFNSDVIFSNCTFKKKVTLERSTVQGDLKLIDCTFESDISLRDVSIAQNCDCSGSLFSADFAASRVRVQKNLLLRTTCDENQGNARRQTTFLGETRLGDAHISGNAYLDGCFFGALVSLNGARIEKDLGICLGFDDSITKPLDPVVKTVFKGKATFEQTIIGGNLFVGGTEFEADTSFLGCSIAGHLLFTFDANGNRSAHFCKKLEASFLHIAGGFSLQECIFDGPATFSAVVVAGDLNAWNVAFNSDVDFGRAHIGGSAVFASSAAGKLSATKFSGPASFAYARFAGTAHFAGVTFSSSASFQRVTFEGSARFDCLWITSPENADPNLSKLDEIVESNTQPDAAANHASQPHFAATLFSGEADFGGASFKEIAWFDGTQFRADSSFLESTFRRAALFRARFVGSASIVTTFEGDTSFFLAHFEGWADFGGALFKNECNFDLSTFSASFSAIPRKGSDDATPIPTRFKKDVWFRGISVTGWADLNGVVFEGVVLFHSGTIAGLLNCPNLKSTGDFHFENMSAHASVNFDDAEFSRKANFGYSRFQGTLDFPRTSFYGEFSLENSRIEGTLNLTSARFLPAAMDPAAAKVTFADCTVRVLLLADTKVTPSKSPPSPAVSRILALLHVYRRNLVTEQAWDLRGLTFERVEVGADWRSILMRQVPYDRQPYAQFQKFLRAAGREEVLGDVYYESRFREMTEQQHTFAGQLKQLSRWIVFRFGVRPVRLLWANVLAIALGLLIFLQPGALRYASETEAIDALTSPSTLSKAIQQPAKRQFAQPTSKGQQLATHPTQETTNSQPAPQSNSLPPPPSPVHKSDAIAFTLRSYLPGASILPLGSQVSVKRNAVMPFIHIRYEDYAVFHGLAGLFLFPLGLAAIAGLLKRRDE